jgi:hypothetical protein
MPGNASGRQLSRGGLQPSTETRSTLRTAATGRSLAAAARACAARLMASASGLEIPRLRAACLDAFRPQTVYAGAFTLARNLLLAGIGTSEDWERSNGDPVSFMLHTVQRAAAGFNQRIIDQWRTPTLSSAFTHHPGACASRNSRTGITCLWR